jgi:hypothetical protein
MDSLLQEYLNNPTCTESACAQGPQGEQGIQGLAGFEWDTTRIGAKQYVIGDIVNYSGGYYICIANNDAIVPTSSLGVYWNAYSFVGPQGIQGLTGAQGPTGPQGVAGPVGPAGLEWNSSWVSGASYVENDAVGYNGASYFCIQATSGTIAPNLDTANWALLASQGSQGPTGPQGIQGPQGASSVPVLEEKTATGTVVPTSSKYTEVVTTSSITRTLPTPTVALKGYIVNIKNGSSGIVSISGHIDNVAGFLLTQSSLTNYQFQCSGTTWWII